MNKPPDNIQHEHALLKTNLKQLRLPTIGAEFQKLAREAADANQSFEQYLLRLTELDSVSKPRILTSRDRKGAVRQPGKV